VLVKYHLALSCFTLKDYQNALIYLTDIIEAIPGEVDFYETRALLFQELNAHDLAVKVLDNMMV
jgi:Tfp pilus assembly protein PilF